MYLQHLMHNIQLQIILLILENSYNHYAVHKDSHLNQPYSED